MVTDTLSKKAKMTGDPLLHLCCSFAKHAPHVHHGQSTRAGDYLPAGRVAGGLAIVCTTARVHTSANCYSLYTVNELHHSLKHRCTNMLCAKNVPLSFCGLSPDVNYLGKYCNMAGTLLHLVGCLPASGDNVWPHPNPPPYKIPHPKKEHPKKKQGPPSELPPSFQKKGPWPYVWT